MKDNKVMHVNIKYVLMGNTTGLKKKEYGHLGKLALDSSMMKETAAESKIKCMKLDLQWLIAVR